MFLAFDKPGIDALNENAKLRSEVIRALPLHDSVDDGYQHRW
ncbi:hypothetical protein PFWH6_3530 [Pseudomonas fluorescens WH6]|nr:hypothetical protein PFWH6_3530 [Pseudomonas fluorescens WH6]